MKVLLTLTTLFAAIAAETVYYTGYVVYQLRPITDEQVKLISSFKENASFDFWAAPKIIGLPTTVMVAPDAQESFLQMLIAAEIPYTVLIDDVERHTALLEYGSRVVREERSRQQVAPRVEKGRISFTQYHRYAAIQDYLAELASNYPDIVSLEEIGNSYEGLGMSMVRIGAGSSNNPAIFIEGGIHAREWISPAFVLYLIQELVENESNRNMIENVNWLIVPVLNPDGYEYTHIDDRFWRKTRSIGSRCNGVDANRNFGYYWMEAGASSYECDETYAGPSAFSEPEAGHLRDIINENLDDIKLFLSFHSYGNYIMYPWGYAYELPDNVQELYSLAADVEAAIASVAGTRYSIGTPPQLLYEAAGSSFDWAKGEAGIELSYTLELPGGGSQGFDLPASRILDVCVETFEGVKVFYNYVEQQFRKH